MKTKLQSILLIDDDAPTIFLSEMLLQEANYSEQIFTKETGKKALEFIFNLDAKNVATCSHNYPQLIFLDINMPAMNGWEFLDKYKELKNESHPDSIIIVLTTSINPDDKIKALNTPFVSGFEIKPLTKGVIDSVINRYFAN